FSLHGDDDELNAGHFSGFQCAGADIDPFRLTVNQDAHFLNVYAPLAFRFIVRMRNVMPCSRALSGNEAFSSHDLTPPKSTVRAHFKHFTILKICESMCVLGHGMNFVHVFIVLFESDVVKWE